MWNRKQQMNKEEKWAKTQRQDNGMVVTRGKRVRGSKGKSGSAYGGGRRFVFGWWTHDARYRSCIIKLPAWNPYNFICQCYPINLVKKEKHSCDFFLINLNWKFCDRDPGKGKSCYPVGYHCTYQGAPFTVVTSKSPSPQSIRNAHHSWCSFRSPSVPLCVVSLMNYLIVKKRQFWSCTFSNVSPHPFPFL